jgi:DNA polymerase-3 subunit gamma/tau
VVRTGAGVGLARIFGVCGIGFFVSYTVLAVKWRPRKFGELVGQPHVVQALVNSLASERLHHAYLFSGTRGVGKTTVARILAKALNCEKGIVSEPCGECDACTSIDEGRFVDLIEVDAASRTRVDDTRELLDNVQYSPTRGRFKVYLIDEVHMLSNHSFNALLKTLEEPPPHVKFLLATTDPQKLPITVLSRCLQFHLKKLTKKQIQEQLERICAAENVAYEPDGISAMARAADGSMRDALSLLDQGIALGNGAVETARVNAMLGSIDRDHIRRVLTALAQNDGAALVQQVEELEELAADFSTALDELLSALQQIAVLQLVGGRPIDEEQVPLVPFAESMTAEDVQLYYQIALHGRRDLAICRDMRMGFEMTLLRMLAFRPQSTGGRESREDTGESSSATSTHKGAALKSLAARSGPKAVSGETAGRGADAVDDSRTDAALDQVFADWSGLLAAADIRGMCRQLADHCEVAASSGQRLELVLTKDKEHLYTEQLRRRLEEGLAAFLDRKIALSITFGQPPRATPAEIRIANENTRMREAREAIEQDANIHLVQAAFDAVVEADSIQPIESQKEA